MTTKRETTRRERAVKVAAAASGVAMSIAALPASPAAAAPSQYPGGMNSVEAAFCAWPTRAVICAEAALARVQAESWTQNLFGHRNDGTKANAFQHSYWLARMTQLMSNNPVTAKGFGDRHEAFSFGNPKSMDLHNNAFGATTGAATNENGARFFLKLGADNAHLWGGFPNPAPVDKLWFMFK